jgi:hypothetical protein
MNGDDGSGLPWGEPLLGAIYTENVVIQFEAAFL